MSTPSDSPRIFDRIGEMLNKRFMLSVGIAFLWLLIWIPAALSMRPGPSTLVIEADGSTRPATVPRTTAELEAGYLYFLPVIAVGAAVILIAGILLRYRNIHSMRRILIPNVIALLAWVIIHWLTVTIFNFPALVAFVTVVTTLICWAVLTNLPIWTVEMKAGHVYYHQSHMAVRDDFKFVTRPLPKIEQRLLTQLAEAGISHEALRIYLSWGAPLFLRDELSATILNKYYNKLCELAKKYPRYFRTPSFTPDSYDVGFTQSNLQYTFDGYRNGVKSVLDGMNANAQQNPQMARVPAFVRDKQEAQTAQQTADALYSAYKHDVTLLSKLFADSEDPTLTPDPVYWVTAYDRWRLVWNKTQSIPIEVNLNNLLTLENLPFGLQVLCYCSIEPDKVRLPHIRMMFRGMKAESAMLGFVTKVVSDYIMREAHQFFQVMQGKAALEVGADQFRKQLPAKFNSTSGRDLHITILDWSVDCNIMLDGRVVEARFKEIEDERDIVHLKKLLDMSGMDPAMQAETIMRILMLSNMPSGLHQFPGEALQTRPPTNIVIQQPPQPQLPPGQNGNALPAGAGGNPVNVLPAEIDRKDDSQIRKKARLNNLDDTIELRQDPNDPDLYTS